MTASSNASNGDKATAKQAVLPKHGPSVLRYLEARALISLICEALGEVLGVASEMHSAIYDSKREIKASPEDLCRMREDALTCLSTSEHYLLMLGSVIEDQGSDADRWSERAPYPVYMMSPEAANGR